MLINQQCETSIETVKTDLDRRLLQKARGLANMRLVTVNFDPLTQSVLGFAQRANLRFRPRSFHLH